MTESILRRSAINSRLMKPRSLPLAELIQSERL